MKKTRIVTRSVLGLTAGAVAVLTAVVPAQASASAPGDTHWGTPLAATDTGTGDPGTGDTHWSTPLSSDDTHG